MKLWSLFCFILLQISTVISSGNKRGHAKHGFQCTHPGLFRHSSSCMLFYRCLAKQHQPHHYSKLTLSCPRGLVYNERTKSCSKISPRCRPVEPGFREKQYLYDPSKANRKLSCKNEGFFRHPEDCRKYYRCIDYDGNGQSYKAFEFSCPKSLLYNEKLKACDWPTFSSSCARSSNKEVTKSTSKADSKYVKPEYSDEKFPPLKCEKAGFFRNPHDCTRFYRCVDYSGSGKKFRVYEFKCPAKLIFDEKLETCNWPSKPSSCDVQSSEDKETRDTDKEYEITKPPMEPSPAPESPKETFPCAKEGFFRHPTNCSKFFRCVRNGKRFHSYGFSCPQKLVFDEEISGCNWPDRAAPCLNNLVALSKRPTHFIIKSHLLGRKTKNRHTRSLAVREAYPSFPRLSSIYYETPRRTVMGSFVAKHGPGSDLKCEKEGIFKHPKYCHEFFVCSDFDNMGKSYTVFEFVCPNDMVYDETLDDCADPPPGSPCAHHDKKCDHEGSTDKDEEKGTTEKPPLDVTDDKSDSDGKDKDGDGSSGGKDKDGDGSSGGKDKDDDGSSDGKDKDGDGSSDGKDQDGDGSSDGKDKDGDGSSNGKDKAPIKCKTSGFFRHPDDCNRFYRCVDFNNDGKNFVIYEFRCGDGLVFDEVNSVCNWPSSVPSCSSGDSGTEETGTGTGTGTDKTTDDGTDPGKTKDDGTGTDKTTDDGTGPGKTKDDGTGTDKTTDDGTDPGKTTDDGTGTDKTTDDETGPGKTTDDGTGPGKTTDDETGPGKTKDDGTGTDKTTGDGTGPDTECDKSDGTEKDIVTTEDTSATKGEESTGKDSSDKDTENIECSKAGFFRNPNNCSKFYRCVDFNEDGKTFSIFHFDCPANLVFDEVLSVCNWPDQAQPPCKTDSSTGKDDDGSEGGTTPSSSGDKTDESTDNDGKGSSGTSDGRITTDSSGRESSTEPGGESGTEAGGESGTEAGGESSTESTPDKTDKYPSTGKDKDTSTGKDEETSTKDPNEEKVDGSEDSKKPDDSSNIECTKAGFFRNPNNCSKFYRCVDYNGDGKSFSIFHFDCPDNLVFDEVLSVCNWPNRARPPCKQVGSTDKDDNGSGKESTDKGTSEDEKASTTDSSSDGETTKNNEKESTTESSPGDKGTDKESNGEKSEGTTEHPGKETTKDDGSEKGGETIDSTKPSKEKETTDGESKEATEGSKPSEETTESSTGDDSKDSSSVRCKKAGFFRHPEDCNKFYRCVDFDGKGKSFTIYRFSCPEKTVFDDILDVCVWPGQERPPCGEETTDSTGQEPGGSTEDGGTGGGSTGQEPGGSTEDGGTGGGSTGQEPGGSTEDGGTGGGSTGQEPGGSTEDGGTGGGSTKQEPGGSTEDDGTGGGSTKQEPGGSTEEGGGTTVSDSKDGNGQQPVTSGEMTTKGSEEKSTEIDSSEKSTNKDGEVTTKPTDSTSDGTGGGGTDGSQSSGECKKEGFFRDPKDCNKFYRCVDHSGNGKSFTIYRFSCPEKTVFDDVLDVCVWPNQAQPPCDSTSDSGSTEDSASKTDDTTQPDTISKVTSSDMTTKGGEEKTTTTLKPDVSAEKSTEAEKTTKPDKPCPDKKTTEGTASSTDKTTDGVKDGEDGASGVKDGGDGAGGDSDGTGGDSDGDSNNCTEAGFFRYPDDCSKFYRCVDYGDKKTFRVYHFDCPKNTVFDDVLDVCVWPHQVQPPCPKSKKETEEEETNLIFDIIKR